MANLINYAHKYHRNLIETFIENSYIAPFMVSDVDWLDAKTFHFTQMSVSGYQDHAVGGGWNRGNVIQTDHPYTLEHDRNVEFLMDKREVDESNQTGTIQNVSNQFMITRATPEMDAYFFSKVASEAAALPGRNSANALASYTVDNVVPRLKTVIASVRRYRNKGIVIYLAPEIFDLLSMAEDFQRNIEVTVLVDGGRGIETRISSMDGVQLIEVVETDRFYTGFDFTNGFEPATGSFKINMLAATPVSTKFVPKIESIYFFAPGTHTEGDGYLYQNRAFWDTFVLPNGKDGEIDSIFVDRDTVAV